jgi:hypothetical protein
MHRLSILLIAASLLPAQPPARLRPGYDLLQPGRLKADLTFLSSDAMEGRKSLERGSETAIQWIAAEFAKAGLTPAAGNSYLQPVPLIEYSPDAALTTLTVMVDGNSQTFHGPDVTASFANEVTGAGSVVFAVYGITAP